MSIDLHAADEMARDLEPVDMQVVFAVANPTLAGFASPRRSQPTDVLPGTSRSRIRQGEDGARRRDAAQPVFAQRRQRRGGLGGDRARDQHRPAERPAQPLQPPDQVDRGADRGEVQPVGRADIALQYRAQMQRRIEMGNAGAGGADRAQRRLAGLCRRPGDREHRQHSVADELQYLIFGVLSTTRPRCLEGEADPGGKAVVAGVADPENRVVIDESRTAAGQLHAESYS